MTASRICKIFLFFFQAEDGIRDLTVTGVQTCALPISHARRPRAARRGGARRARRRHRDGLRGERRAGLPDRKSTRLNSSHSQISYAVFCLKKNKEADNQVQHTTTHNDTTTPPLCSKFS